MRWPGGSLCIAAREDSAISTVCWLAECRGRVGLQQARALQPLLRAGRTEQRELQPPQRDEGDGDHQRVGQHDGEPRRFYEWMGQDCDLINDHCDAAPFRRWR